MSIDPVIVKLLVDIPVLKQTLMSMPPLEVSKTQELAGTRLTPFGQAMLELHEGVLKPQRLHDLIVAYVEDQKRQLAREILVSLGLVKYNANKQ